MISISSFWSSIEIPGMSWGKERERAPESTPMLMARVEFSGEHLIPINHIPHDLFGMTEDQCAVFGDPIPNSSKGTVLFQNVRFIGADIAVFAKGEEREDPDKGLMTVIDIPFLQFGFPQNIFLDVDKLKSDLERYAKACGTPLSRGQRKKLATLKKSVKEIEGRFLQIPLKSFIQSEDIFQSTVL